MVVIMHVVTRLLRHAKLARFTIWCWNFHWNNTKLHSPGAQSRFLLTFSLLFFVSSSFFFWFTNKILYSPEVAELNKCTCYASQLSAFISIAVVFIKLHKRFNVIAMLNWHILLTKRTTSQQNKICPDCGWIFDWRPSGLLLLLGLLDMDWQRHLCSQCSTYAYRLFIRMADL